MATETVEVQVGYLATHSDGTTALLRLDRTRSEIYCVTHHATIEPMYVKRPAPRQDGAGGPNEGAATAR